MGQPFYCSAADAGVWGERGYGDGSTPTRDSAVSPCFHGCLAFLHRHFPPQSPPSHPLDLSLSSQQQPLPWDCSTISSSQPLHFIGDLRPYLWYVWLQQGLSYFSFHLGCHKSALSLSALNVSPLTQTIAPMCASVPPPTSGRTSPTNTPVFPPSSFVLLSFVWVYICSSTGQAFLSTLSWYSAFASVSEGVFLMYPSREMCSMSTYSSAILFFQGP